MAEEEATPQSDRPAPPESEPQPLPAEPEGSVEEELGADDEMLASEPPLSGRELWANRLRYFLVGVAIVCIAGIGYLVLTRGVSSPTQVTVSTLTPTHTPTQTITPTPTLTPPPPTETPTPGPTPTPLPPSRYRVQPGDTWLGLAIEYDISLDSILALNGRIEDDYLKLDEEILIPWPTYTLTPDPTLIPTLDVIQELASEQCREHVIKIGETLYAIAAAYEVSPLLLEQVNGITNPDLLKEGQKLCSPLVTPGPPPSPTFGPSPTPADGRLHPAPRLLYPPAGTEVPPGSGQVTLQWTVAGWLAADETYMVEVRNLSRVNSRAVRGFVKTTAWQLPESLYPAVGKIETYAWRVSVVRGEGEPGGEEYRWERSSLPSGWQTFMWMGAAPNVTPTPSS
jgi:LysM repeat protein